MPRTSFPELARLAVEKAPGKYARTLGQKATRLAELEQLDHLTERERTLVRELRLSIRRFVDAFRMLGRCKECGHVLEDPESLARGVGPDCWSKVTDERKQRILAWVAQQEDGAREPA